MKPGTIMEVMSFEQIETCNGPAVGLKVILPEHEKTRDETAMTIPIRFIGECEKKVPCLLYYQESKKLEGGKRCHNVRFVNPDDTTIFHASDDEADDEASDSEETQGYSIEDFMPTCTTCGESNQLCLGRCSRCHGHQPIDGSQCRC